MIAGSQCCYSKGMEWSDGQGESKNTELPVDKWQGRRSSWNGELKSVGQISPDLSFDLRPILSQQKKLLTLCTFALSVIY